MWVGELSYIIDTDGMLRVENGVYAEFTGGGAWKKDWWRRLGVWND
jgi:hypothetical protein